MSAPAIYTNHRNNTNLRTNFYTFTRTIFPGVDFSIWYDRGYWSDKYIPFSLVEDDKIVSNVSVSQMKILVDGHSMDGLQIGTVGTLPDYRNRGLSKFLMQYVLNKYKNTNIIFLFANDTVLDFYPRFGLKRYNEVIFKSISQIPGSNYAAKKLDISNKSDLSIIDRCINQREDLTKLFGATDYDFITYWHLLNIFPDNLFYMADDEVIIICEEKENQLHLWDVIYTKPFDLSLAISKVIKGNNLQSILYYFPPDQLPFRCDEVVPDNNSYLFVKGDFRIKDKEFKFPITAQT